MKIFIGSSSSGGAGNKILAANGAVAISNGSSTVSAVYATAIPSSSYALSLTVRNVTDGSPIFLQSIITAKSTTGFTATFNAPADSANYLLEYMAVINV